MTVTAGVGVARRPMSNLATWGVFLARRISTALLAVLIVSLLVFAFVHAAPGGPEQSIGGRFATPEQLALIRQQYRLDDPVWAQYWRFLTSALHLDFGTSFATREPAVDSIAAAASTTLPLVLVSWFIANVLGTAAGILSARHDGRTFDRIVLAVSVVGASSPVFATGILLSFLFAVQLGWFPALGEGRAGLDRVAHLVLPAATLVIAAIAAIAKVTKVRVGQVLDSDHVTFATARGLPDRWVLRSEVLRNSGVQLVTQSGAVLISLLAGVILVEEVFDLRGVGTLLMDAITARDIPLIQAITLFTSVFIVAVNLIVDLVCMAIDPRLRVQGKGIR